MNLPFTTDQFLQVFAGYNQAVWPLQLLWNALALLTVGLAIRKTRISGRGISLILALLWIWMGVVYHWLYFSPINKAALLFGAVFVAEGILFLWIGAFRNALSYRLETNARGITGLVLIVYALLLYPLIGGALGHSYPYSPTFGLPCPTTIFTFGLLLWLDRKPPFSLLVIPLLWSFIGFTAALQLGIREDTGLLVAGLVAVVWSVLRRRSLQTAPGRLA